MVVRKHRSTGDAPPAEVRVAEWPRDLETVRGQFTEYVSWIADHADPSEDAQPRVRDGLALLARLRENLAIDYGPPRGEVRLWSHRNSIVACGAIRELSPGIADAKRIFIRPDYRGIPFGRPFVQDLIARARELGYTRVRVDTLGSMEAAIEFYQEAGFRPIGEYWPHPAARALFFEYSFPLE